MRSPGQEDGRPPTVPGGTRLQGLLLPGSWHSSEAPENIAVRGHPGPMGELVQETAWPATNRLLADLLIFQGSSTTLNRPSSLEVTTDHHQVSALVSTHLAGLGMEGEGEQASLGRCMGTGGCRRAIALGLPKEGHLSCPGKRFG